MTLINLDPYLGRGGGRVSILSGKDRGLDLRKEFRLDELENNKEPTTISVPPDLRRVTPSFVLGLFSRTFAMLTTGQNVTRDQVKAAFFDMYSFAGDTKNVDKVREQVSETIDDLFAARSALDEMGRGFGQIK